MHLTWIFLGFAAAIVLLAAGQRVLPPLNAVARVSAVLTRVLGAVALLGGVCLLGIAGWLLLRGETDWSLGCLLFGLLFGGLGFASLRLARTRPAQAGGQ
jgi:uncharacterized membrane protein SirB2